MLLLPVLAMTVYQVAGISHVPPACQGVGLILHIPKNLHLQKSMSHTGPLCPWYITVLVQFSTSQMIYLHPPEVQVSHRPHRWYTSISVLVLFIKVLVRFPTSQRIYLYSPKSRSHQGMTIRTAWLPGAGNLLSRAGEDLSGLPDQASHYQVFYFFLLFFIDNIIIISIQALDFESLWQLLYCRSTTATWVSF